MLSENGAMLGKTSLSAIRSLLYIAQQDPAQCVSPRRVAEALGESPSYLAKVVRHLVKAGVLRAEKGAKGGVRLVRSPRGVTLLSIVEACQGAIVGDYCSSVAPASSLCNFHRAAMELHNAVTGVLRRWTLGDLLEAPYAPGDSQSRPPCLMSQGLRQGRKSDLIAPGRVYTKIGGSGR